MMNHPIQLFTAVALLVALPSCVTVPPEPEQSRLHTEPAPLYQNDAGWTVFSPSADSRILYVSNDGNDGTAEAYQKSDPQVGQDPHAPAGQVKAFKTFKAAFKHTREGHPDWILLKRGDIFYESVAVRNGRSDNEPFLLASYGSSPEVPVVKTGSERALRICCESFSYIALQGIDFYAHTRDFNSPDFASSEGGSGFYVLVKEGHYGTGLLIEGCKFRFFTGNVVQAKGRISNVTLRRNVIVDNYSTRSHSQGLFASNVSITLEENIFDHNGWYKQQQTDRIDNKEGGQGTMFNHNTYFEDTYEVVFRNNIFLRPASIGTKWTANSGKASTRDIEITNNLYFDGEIGISMGGNKKGPLRFKNISIADNVLVNLGESMSTGRDFAWYVEIKDWDHGSVSGNTLIHPGSRTTNNIFAIKLTGETRAVDIADNLIYGFGNGYILAIDEKADLSNVQVSDNAFYFQESGRYFVRAKNPLDNIEFSSNRYFSESNLDESFSVEGDELSIQDWRNLSGETGSRFTTTADLTFDTTKVFQVNALTASSDAIDPDNIIEAYQAAMGKPASMKSFIEDLRRQSHTNWDSDYTAQSINLWIRQNLAVPKPE